MVLIEKPYFLTNEEWFEYDEKNKKYILTDKAPEKAKKSYNEFYEKLDGYERYIKKKLENKK